jgi:hypothetical protein
LAFDLLEDVRLSLDDLVPRLLGFDDVPDADLVEPSGFFFAIASDERNGGPAIGEPQHGGSPGERDFWMARMEPSFERLRRRSGRGHAGFGPSYRASCAATP